MGRSGKSKKKHSQTGEQSKKGEPKIVEHVTDSDDEEIDEDQAFNSEDERMYGHFFSNHERDNDEDEVTSEDEYEDSESNDEDEEDDGGQYMLDLLDKLDSNSDKKNDSQDVSQMANIKESEYSSSVSKKGLTLENLMEGLQDTQGFRHLQKAFQKQQAATPAPLNKVIADRSQRKIAYAEQVRNISGWTDVVQENRRAETLDFKPKERLEVTRDNLVDKFEPTTAFEKELEEALEEAGHQDEDAVLKAEEQALQDDLGANRLTLAEYKKRRGQLAQIRALMFYHEQKRHHIKKIKSKKYRRIRKKQRERLKESALEAALEEDGDLAKELKEKEEISRIQERMTLAHKNTSKWAKRILKRGKNVDMETRRALSAQLKRGDDLRKKMMGEGGNESDDASDDENLVESARKVLLDTEIAQDPTDGKTGLFKLSFMQKGIERQRERARQEARKLLAELEANKLDDYDETNKKEHAKDDIPHKIKIASEKEMSNVLQQGALVATPLAFGNSNTIATSGGIEIDLLPGDREALDDNLDARMIIEKNGKQMGTTNEDFSTMIVSRKVTPVKEGRTSHGGQGSRKNTSKAGKEAVAKQDEDESNPWLSSKVTSGEADGLSNHVGNKSKKAIVDVGGAATILDAGKKDLTEKAEHHSRVTEIEDGGDKKLTMLTQEELVRKAFAAPSDKEVEEEFRKEKEDMATEEDPTRKVKDAKANTEVAGWGCWTGAGALPPPRRRKLAKKMQAPRKKQDLSRKRKDDKKPDVIINQKRLKKTANNFMLGEVPHPYSSRAEYEQAMLGGVGKEWNVTSSFKGLTRPEILTRSGKIIQPISKKAKVVRPAAKF